MDKINRIVANFLSETEIRDMQDFTFLNRLIDIYEKHYKFPSISKYRRRVPFDKSYKYSYDFLSTVNPMYAEYLEECRNNYILDIVRGVKKDDAYSTIEDGKHIIYLPIKEIIADSYDLTHEVIHDMSLVGNTSLARHLFCEMLSLTMEGLQYDYLKTLRVKECQIEPNALLRSIKEKCDIIKLEEHLISTYLDKCDIDAKDIVDLADAFDYKFIATILKYIKKENNLSTDIWQRYVIGYLLSCYLIDRIHENPKNIQEFLDLNEMINQYEIEDVLDYLDLELTDDEFFTLTDESYAKIEKSYVKRLKEM